MRAAERRQPLRQFLRHVLGRLGRSRRDGGQAGRDGEQVLDPVAHFTRQQLMAFLGLLASGDVDENSDHDATDDVRILALTARRDPADLVAEHDAEVDFVGADDGPRRGERRPHPVAVRRVDMGGQVFEVDIIADRHAPEFDSARSSMVNLSVSTFHDHRATPAAAIASRKCVEVPERQSGSSEGSARPRATAKIVAMPSCVCVSIAISNFISHSGSSRFDRPITAVAGHAASATSGANRAKQAEKVGTAMTHLRNRKRFETYRRLLRIETGVVSALVVWLPVRPSTERIEDGDTGGLEIRYVARYYRETVFQRRGRDHEIGAVIAERGAQGAPTSRRSQVEWHNPLAVEGQYPVQPGRKRVSKAWISARAVAQCRARFRQC